VYALDNACPHAGANLAGGTIVEGCVVCPKHGWPFRLESGQLRDTPGVNVDIYPIRIVDQPDGRGVVQVELPLSPRQRHEV
jgi:nitrite reductase/ring-hydroxylating ferredoxin subunit